MPTLFVQDVATDDPGSEEPAATRERLKEQFARGATRRMTQLGLLVGATLQRVTPQPDDVVIYASEYAETRALESYLDSFPTASPTLFQTSIHPSAVQQTLIQRQQALPSLFPLTGRAQLVIDALLVALVSENDRAIFCGGEERGTYLLAENAASPRAFAFSLALTRTPAGARAKLDFPTSPSTTFAPALSEFFDALHRRENFQRGGGENLFSLVWS